LFLILDSRSAIAKLQAQQLIVKPPVGSPTMSAVPGGQNVGKPGNQPTGQVVAVQNQKQNKLTPVDKPGGLDSVLLLGERENRYNDDT